jgi:hypothetical protein
VKGKWAQGLEPRFFCWVIKDKLAASERPGGYGRNHRKVRRQEEIIWLRQHEFTSVLSLLDSPHNLHAYDEMDMPHAHVPLGRGGDVMGSLPEVYKAIADLIDEPKARVLVHAEEFGDRLSGVLAGFLVYAGMVTDGPRVITVVEHLTGRQMGTEGREIVATTLNEGLRRR